MSHPAMRFGATPPASTPLSHSEAERQVKHLQKDFLLFIEQHAAFQDIGADAFEDVRRQVFRSTFTAFRLGVVGTDRVKPGLLKHFFGWLDTRPELKTLPPAALDEIADRCLTTALEAFRVGALVLEDK